MSYRSDVLSTYFMRWDLYTIESTGKIASNGQFQLIKLIKQKLHFKKESSRLRAMGGSGIANEYLCKECM
jgi:hypothetical protein